MHMGIRLDISVPFENEKQNNKNQNEKEVGVILQD